MKTAMPLHFLTREETKTFPLEQTTWATALKLVIKKNRYTQIMYLTLATKGSQISLNLSSQLEIKSRLIRMKSRLINTSTVLIFRV
jgi:hypothetical protein